MIPLIGVLLCFYLVFKGFEIFQIAWAQPDPRTGPLILGVIAVAASFVLALLFGFLFISSGASLTSPALPRI